MTTADIEVFEDPGNQLETVITFDGWHNNGYDVTDFHYLFRCGKCGNEIEVSIGLADIGQHVEQCRMCHTIMKRRNVKPVILFTGNFINEL